VGSIIGVKS